jgi:hypothetical protein
LSAADPEPPITETLGILRTALSLAWRRPLGQLGLVVLSALALWGLLAGSGAVTDVLVPPGADPDPTPSLGFALAMIGSLLATVLLAAVIVAIQRGAAIVTALEPPGAYVDPTSAVLGRVGALVRLILVLSLLDGLGYWIGWYVATHWVALPDEPDELVRLIIAITVLICAATRSWTGLAVARVRMAGEPALAAIAHSARTLSGHRLAAFASRLGVLPLAALAMTVHGEGWPAPPAIGLAPLLVLLDASIDAAWYERLCTKPEKRDLVAVFE